MTRFNIVFLLIFLLPVSFSAIASESTEEDNDEHDAIQSFNAQSIIILDEETQDLSGIETTQLHSVKFHPEFIVFGKAISILPLLTVQQQYFSASTKQIGAKARFNQSEKDISRLRDLHRDQAISTRKLQNQQSQWQSDQAIYKETSNQRKLIIAQSNLQWGNKLTQWAIEKHSTQFNRLTSGESTLLQITLPIGDSIPVNTASILVSPSGKRDKAFEASFISPFPQVNEMTQGLQYLFIADGNKIKAGMNFSAWIPQQIEKQHGVIIPKTSLGWHLGQAFVFIKIDDDQFIHRNISNPVNVANGYFITDDIKDGEEIVITGSQMLLSHEFRSQIPDEDDD